MAFYASCSSWQLDRARCLRQTWTVAMAIILSMFLYCSVIVRQHVRCLYIYVFAFHWCICSGVWGDTLSWCQWHHAERVGFKLYFVLFPETMSKTSPIASPRVSLGENTISEYFQPLKPFFPCSASRAAKLITVVMAAIDICQCNSF